MSRINYRADDLRALLALQRTRSFVRGAELLNITQSAFSRRIAQLETAVGASLVERTTRNVALSALGLDLVREAGPLLGGLDEALKEASRRARGESGRIVVACLTTAAYALLPSALDVFRRSYPNVRLHLLDATAKGVKDSVVQGQAEFGLAVIAGTTEGLHAEHITDDGYVVAFQPSHPLARQKEVKWSTVQAWRPVALRTTSTQQIDDDLAAAGIAPPWFDEVAHFASLLGLLRSGSTVGVVPRLALHHDIGDLVVRPLVQPSIGRQIGRSVGRTSNLECQRQLYGASSLTNSIKSRRKGAKRAGAQGRERRGRRHGGNSDWYQPAGWPVIIRFLVHKQDADRGPRLAALLRRMLSESSSRERPACWPNICMFLTRCALGNIFLTLALRNAPIFGGLSLQLSRRRQPAVTLRAVAGGLIGVDLRPVAFLPSRDVINLAASAHRLPCRELPRPAQASAVGSEVGPGERQGFQADPADSGLW